MIVMTVAFFAVAVGYVALCNRIIGPDDLDDDAGGADPEAVGAAVGP